MLNRQSPKKLAKEDEMTGKLSKFSLIYLFLFLLGFSFLWQEPAIIVNLGLFSVIIAIYLMSCQGKVNYFLVLFLLIEAVIFYLLEESYIIYFCLTVNGLIITYFLAKKDLKKQFQISAIMALAILIIPLIKITSWEISNRKIEREKQTEICKIEKTITSKTARLEKISERISQDDFLKRLFLEKKYKELSNYSQTLMVGNRLTYLVITDNYGNVLVRAHKPKAIGDNLFQSMPETENLLENYKVQIIKDSADNTLSEITGKPIKDKLNTIGSVFLGFNFDNNLALEISKKNHTNLAFLSGEEVLGSSFNDQQTTKEVLQTENFTQSLAGENRLSWVQFKSKGYNLLFWGLKDEKGSQIGKIVIVGNEDSIKETRKMFSLLLIILLIVLLLIYMVSLLRNGNLLKLIAQKSKKKIIFFCASLIFYLLTNCFLINTTKAPTINLAKPLLAGLKSRLSLKLDNNYFKKGEDVAVDLIGLPTEKSYSAEVVVKFPKNLLEVKSLKLDDTDCRNYFTNYYDNQSGELRLTCEFKTQDSRQKLIGKIIFTTKEIGIANLKVMPRYSYLLTDSGKAMDIKQNLIDGENLIISN